ncbi:MAG: hypothetical protein ACO3DJ_04605 [Alphaproteobacteria bacterium]
MVDCPERGSGLPAASAKKNATSSLPGPAWPLGTTLPVAVTTKLKGSRPAGTGMTRGASPLACEAGGMPVVSPTVCGGLGPVSETSSPPARAPQLKRLFENSASLPMYSMRMLPGPVMLIVAGLPTAPSRTIELVMKAKSLPTSGVSTPPARVKKGAAPAAPASPMPAASASAARLVAVLGLMGSSCWVVERPRMPVDADAGRRAREARAAAGRDFASPVPGAVVLVFAGFSWPGPGRHARAVSPGDVVAGENRPVFHAAAGGCARAPPSGRRAAAPRSRPLWCSAVGALTRRGPGSNVPPA